MSELEDLKQSYTDMTTEELMIHLKKIRKGRRSPIIADLKSVGSKKKAKKSKDKFADVSKGMSAEEIQAFLKKATGGLS